MGLVIWVCIKYEVTRSQILMLSIFFDGRDGNPRPNFFLDPSSSRPISRSHRPWCLTDNSGSGMGRLWRCGLWVVAWLLLAMLAAARPAAVVVALVRPSNRDLPQLH